MAWIRTAASLISFGFTIYKFFQFENALGEEGGVKRWLGPSQFAEAMIVVGVASLLLASMQHHLQLQALRRQFGALPYSLAWLTGGFIGGLGVVALVLVALRQ